MSFHSNVQIHKKVLLTIEVWYSSYTIFNLADCVNAQGRPKPLDLSNYDWRRWLDKAAGRIDAALVDVGAALVYLSARIEEFIRALNGSRFGNAGNLPEIRWIY